MTIQRPKADRHLRQLCLIAKEAFNATPEADYSSIAEDIKTRATRLRLSFTSLTVCEAMSRVGKATAWRGPARALPAAPAFDPVPAPRPPQPRGASHVCADGTVIRQHRAGERVSASVSGPPLSLGEIFQELARRSPFTPERSSHGQASQGPKKSEVRHVSFHPA
jgi:hypothetical protein